MSLVYLIVFCETLSPECDMGPSTLTHTFTPIVTQKGYASSKENIRIKAYMGK